MNDTKKKENEEKALADAAMRGDLAGVRDLLAQGVSPLGKVEHLFPKVDVGRLEKGAIVDLYCMRAMHPDGARENVALALAAFHGHEDVVSEFLTRKDLCSVQSLSIALYGAACSESTGIVSKLLEAGANPLFEDGAALKKSMGAGHADMTAVILGKVRNKGLALDIMIREHNKDQATALLGGEDRQMDLYPAIYSICAALDDRDNVWNRQDVPYYIDMLHMLFGYAEARGADMPALLAGTMKQAVKEWASPVIGAVLAQPDFARAPHRQALLDLAMGAVVASADSAAEVAEFDRLGLAERLLQEGASSALLLESAISARRLDMAEMALQAGADPRMKHVLQAQARVVQTQGRDRTWEEAHAVYERVRSEAGLRSQSEYAALFGAAPLSPDKLRAVTESGHSGLAVALMTGRGSEAIDVLAAAEKPLCAHDLLLADRNGYAVIDHIAGDFQQMQRLLRRENWLLREEEYAKVWALVAERPVGTVVMLQEQHRETLQALSAARNLHNIRIKAASKPRFTLK